MTKIKIRNWKIWILLKKMISAYLKPTQKMNKMICSVINNQIKNSSK